MHLEWPSIFSNFNDLKVSGTGDTRNIGQGNYFKHSQRTPWYGDRSTRSGLPGAAIFGAQDFKTEALTLTSASIVKAGLHKIWQTEPKLSSHERLSETDLGVPSVPLQDVVNEKQLEQSIIHTPRTTVWAAATPTPFSLLPSPNASQPESELPTPKPSTAVGLHLLEPVATFPSFTRLPLPLVDQPEQEPYTPAGPQHPFRSRCLSFSLQKAANKNPGSEQSIIQPSNLEASNAFSSDLQLATAPILPRLSL